MLIEQGLLARELQKRLIAENRQIGEFAEKKIGQYCASVGEWLSKS